MKIFILLLNAFLLLGGIFQSIVCYSKIHLKEEIERIDIMICAIWWVGLYIFSSFL